MSKLAVAQAELAGAVKAKASPEVIRLRKRRLLIVLAEDLGLNQREREVISQFCVRAEHCADVPATLTEYDAAHRGPDPKITLGRTSGKRL